MTAPPELVWRAPLFDATGYASEARDFVLGLDAAGVPVRAEPIPWLPPEPDAVGEEADRLHALTSAAVGPAAVRVQHAFPRFWELEDGAVSVGRTMFETDRIPADWVPLCNAAREVWVPTRWNVETFAASGVERSRLQVVPGPLRLAHWRHDEPPLELGLQGRFVFLSVFDWSLRKGWDVLLRAYCREFSAVDDVALVLRVHSSYGLTGEDLQELLARGCLGTRASVVLLDRLVPAAELPRLYRAADCFVLPTRGEGWGRTFAEAMASGTPAIGTRWGGHTEFMDDGNSYLLDVEGVVRVPAAALEEAPHFRGHRWAEPSVEHLRQLMRNVYEHPAEAKARGRRAREDLRRYDVSAVCARVLDRVAALAAA